MVKDFLRASLYFYLSNADGFFFRIRPPPPPQINFSVVRAFSDQLTDPFDRFSLGPFGLITRALAVAEPSESESLESQFSVVGLCRISLILSILAPLSVLLKEKIFFTNQKAEQKTELSNI